MGRRAKWGGTVCLDCAAELLGLCPTCTQARLAAVKAYRDSKREERNAYSRAYWAQMPEYQRARLRARRRKADNK